MIGHVVAGVLLLLLALVGDGLVDDATGDLDLRTAAALLIALGAGAALLPGLLREVASRGASCCSSAGSRSSPWPSWRA